MGNRPVKVAGGDVRLESGAMETQRFNPSKVEASLERVELPDRCRRPGSAHASGRLGQTGAAR